MKPSTMNLRALFLPFMTLVATVVGTIAAVLPAAGQNPSASGESEKAAVSEIATQEREPSFQLRVERNLVLVRVVVRDSEGQQLSGLNQTVEIPY
ncbi:MAG: hypothetical protein LAP13_26475 [Acidobacteriia bacterium]|nr:hypothetical protein [Terriglobia bacterium]